MPASKRRTSPKHSSRAKTPAPKPWAWHEVLDAALLLDDGDFMAVLCEMLMVRHERQQHLARRHQPPAYAPSDIPFDDPYEDDPFDEVPAAIPLASRRRRARKR